jgi:hypothetical protein
VRLENVRLVAAKNETKTWRRKNNFLGVRFVVQSGRLVDVKMFGFQVCWFSCIVAQRTSTSECEKTIHNVCKNADKERKQKRKKMFFE